MASESRMADIRVFCNSECRLHKAALKGEKRKLDELLRREGVVVDQQNADGQTALYIACQRGHYSIVKRLIRNGADPNCRSMDGVTPVHAAAASGNAKLLGMLVLAGGDLRLHDFMGRSVRDWSDLQENPRKRRSIYDFIEKMKHVAVETATGNSLLHETTVLLNQTLDGNKSIFKRMRSKKGPISVCRSTIFSNGFGKVVARADNSCGIMGQYHMITRENLRYSTSSSFWENGAFTVMESMFWRDRPVTVKRLNGMMRDGGHVDLLIQELEQMHQLRHPAILYLIGTSRNDSMEDLTLVFEKIKFSSLYHNLHERHESLSLIQTSLMMGQISGALLYLHLNDLVHCNVTSHAVFLTDDFQAKLGNFEYMIHAKSGSTSRVTSHKYTNAFYNWMAPEVMRGEVPTFKSDLYSFSAIIWEIVIGDMPWRDVPAEVIMEQMLERGVGLQSTLPNRANKSLVIQPFKSIMDYGLQLQPCERLIELEEMEKSLSDFFTTNFYPPALTRECPGNKVIKTSLERATPTSRFTFSDIDPRLTAGSSSPRTNDGGTPERPASANLCAIVPPARKRFSFRKNSGTNFFFSRKSEVRESKSSAPTDASPDDESRLNGSSKGTVESVRRMPRKLSLPPARVLKGCQQFLSKSFRAMSCKSSTNEDLGRTSSKTKNTQTDTEETKDTDARRYERFRPLTVVSTTFSRKDVVGNKDDLLVSSVMTATSKLRDSPRRADRFDDRNFSPDTSMLSNEIDYSFIRNPLKRAFFESSPPAAAAGTTVNPRTGRMFSPSPCGGQVTAAAGGSYSQASLSKFSYAWMPRPYQKKPNEDMVERNLKKETEMFFERRPGRTSVADLPPKPDLPAIEQQPPYQARREVYCLPGVVSPPTSANKFPESRDSLYNGFRGILKATDQRGISSRHPEANISATAREPVEMSDAESRLPCRSSRKMTDGDVANLLVPKPFLKKQELCSSLETGLGQSAKDAWKPAAAENTRNNDWSGRRFFHLGLPPVGAGSSKIRTSLSQPIGSQQGGLVSVDAPLPYKPSLPEHYFSPLQKGGDGLETQQAEGEMSETKQLFSMSIKEFETKMQELWEDNEESNTSKNRKPSEFGMARCSTRKAKTRSACSRRSPIMTAAEIKPWPVKCHSQYLLSSNNSDRRQSLDRYYEVGREEGQSFDGRWFSPCFARANSSQRRSMSKYYQFCFNGRNLEPSPIKKSFTELPSIGVKPASHSVQAKVLKSSCSYLSSSFEELTSPSKRESNVAFEVHDDSCSHYHHPHHFRLSPSRGSIKELVRSYQKMIDEHGRKQSFLQRIKSLREDFSPSAVGAGSKGTSPYKAACITPPEKVQKEIMKSCFKNWKQNHSAKMEE